jgi:hypothetical protein
MIPLRGRRRRGFAADPVDGGMIPEVMRELKSVIIAVITADGALKDANRGFLSLMAKSTSANDLADIRDLFAGPRFEHLTARRPTGGETILYRGTLNLGDPEGSIISVQATIFVDDGDLLLVGEREPEDPRLISSTVLELHEELAEAQRRIGQLKRELVRCRKLVPGSYRFRDERHPRFDETLNLPSKTDCPTSC